ncbi:cytochrome P450 [Paractinoplanes ferrugineus]|uniref:Cytochrome P450 n=1 Tax=Paractinoplanes ferrugineus TaxID=113564 RepID=A0A919M8C0_9ACTN|nr:cytochrome P450 [Actinoplanes ferrugineus]GIE10321.1 cytochrome P450 [Actinoplanes ferrugineus]
MTQDIRDDLADPDFHNDPHPSYARWRQTGPVRPVVLPGGYGGWLVTRYEDARQALTDPRLSKDFHTVQRSNDPLPPDIGAAIGHHMLAADPPDHTRLRRLVTAAFTARRIEGLRPRIEQITDELLDAMAGRDEVDLIDALAFPLPIRVICELLGIPADDQDSFRAWSNTLVGGEATRAQLPAAMTALVSYVRALIADRRRQPGADLLSGLIAVRDEADRLSEDELSSMVFLLLIAGHETTVNLIGNGSYLLLSQRERWERLRADPALLPTAIEEFLRYESPVETASYRITTEAVQIGGTLVPAGEIVVVGLLSANRDEQRFPDPAELRLDRPQNPHMAFGHGIHYCLGAPLARLEASVAFGRLLARFPDLRLASDEEPGWRPGLLMRGLRGLPVLTA